MGRKDICAPGFVAPRGYQDAVLIEDGRRMLVLGGHVAFDTSRRLLHPGDLVAQFRVTLVNLKATLAAAGFTVDDLVKLTIHVTDVLAYRAHLRDLGTIWKEVFGRFYPAMTLLGVTALMEPGSVVEIDGLAVK